MYESPQTSNPPAAALALTSSPGFRLVLQESSIHPQEITSECYCIHLSVDMHVPTAPAATTFWLHADDVLLSVLLQGLQRSRTPRLGSARVQLGQVLTIYSICDEFPTPKEHTESSLPDPYHPGRVCSYPLDPLQGVISILQWALLKLASCSLGSLKVALRASLRCQKSL